MDKKSARLVVQLEFSESGDLEAAYLATATDKHQELLVRFLARLLISINLDGSQDKK